MKLRHVCVGVLVLVLAVVLGCKKPEAETTAPTGPVTTGPAKVAKAPVEPAGGGDLPAVGDKIKLTPDMGATGVDEGPEEVEFEVVAVDEARLKELGVDAYPGAVGVKEVGKTDEPGVAMLTRDAVAKVTEHYTKAGLKDLTETLNALMGAAGEIAKATGTAVSPEEKAKADEVANKVNDEMAKLKMVMLVSADEKTSVIVMPAGEYTLIGVGKASDMGGRTPEGDAAAGPGEPAKTE